jgi:hypothetical protein
VPLLQNMGCGTTEAMPFHGRIFATSSWLQDHCGPAQFDAGPQRFREGRDQSLVLVSILMP